MLSRIVPAPGETQPEVFNAEIGQIIDEINKGIDVNSINNKAISSDKLRILFASAAFYIGNIAAGARSSISINIGSGFYYPLVNYPLTVSQDFYSVFVDPAGINPASPTLKADLLALISSAYPSGNTNYDFRRDIPSYVFGNTVVGSNTNQLYGLIYAVHNTDSVAHDYYVIMDVPVIAPAQVVPSS